MSRGYFSSLGHCFIVLSGSVYLESSAIVVCGQPSSVRATLLFPRWSGGFARLPGLHLRLIVSRYTQTKQSRFGDLKQASCFFVHRLDRPFRNQHKLERAKQDKPIGT
jgi:hypothetical protein